MWLLSPEQAARLAALQRRRDLQRVGEGLGTAFPESRGRLGERWDGFVEHGAVRAAAYGLTHMLCVARFLASWIASGADFETRQPWAAAILTDDKRSQGAKAYQLCVLVGEQLRSAPQLGQPAAADFSQALRQLDDRLAGAGTLASLLPRERIRLGAACDVDAVELRLVDPRWRQHYTAEGGPWRREACAPRVTSVTLVHDALADAAPRLPQQVTLLSRPASADAAAALRVRVKAEHRCDGSLHPLVQWLDPSGSRSLRGDMAGDATFVVHASAIAEGGALAHMGEEDSPQFSTLTVASCGLRARGVPIGDASTLLAAYDAAQHLVAWRREPVAASSFRPTRRRRSLRRGAGASAMAISSTRRPGSTASTGSTASSGTGSRAWPPRGSAKAASATASSPSTWLCSSAAPASPGAGPSRPKASPLLRTCAWRPCSTSSPAG